MMVVKKKKCEGQLDVVDWTLDGGRGGMAVDCSQTGLVERVWDFTKFQLKWRN